MSELAGPGLQALSSLTPAQLSLIRSLPKAELHAHLNGSIPLPILQDLASSYISSGSETTVSNEAVQAGLEKLKVGVILNEIGDFFGLFPAIYALTSTPDSLAYATRGVLDAFFLPSEDFSGPECTYLELRSTPRETPHMTREVYLRTVLSTADKYLQTLPPLPESLVHESSKRRIGVIASLDRRMSKEVMDEIVDIAVRLKREGLGIVGVDLCGDPSAGDVAEWKDVFEKVRMAGLGVTLHIAETLNNSSQETMCLLSYKPDRLGHATFLDEEAKGVVLLNKTCIEICLTSNLLCKTVASLKSHHIRYWLQRQHPIAICTDDILPFRNTLTAEYALLLAQPPFGLGLTEDEVRTIAEMSLDSRFLA
ncbi:hypothetical protein D9756_004351 [Leucocoprinus leucothites]|uniref:Adenosine deaminase domain-containing protein n=1 Tax=Leucocoprinus leucothites TaxID=201217 RepID=A0A8H5D963_9AGAR|nr:hypothetical protein D9756_004351 [Leucoagaricus leucothites]